MDALQEIITNLQTENTIQADMLEEVKKNILNLKKEIKEAKQLTIKLKQELKSMREK